MARFDAVVIGAGPGGYVCAIRLAQLGKKVAIVERERVGGVCLNCGCIPSKALIQAAHLLDRIRHGAEMGIVAEKVRLDLAALQKWKTGVVDRLTGGVAQLLKGNGATLFEGAARFEDRTHLTVENKKGKETIEFGSAVVATGGRPIELPTLKFDGETVISSKEALELDAVPKSLVVIGGGVIGLELGMMWQELGARLTVVELLPTLLPGTDPECVKVVQRTLKKREAEVYLESKATSVTKKGKTAVVAIETPKGKVEVEADKVLVAVGVRPNTEGLALDKAGVAADKRGFIPVNDRLQSNVPTIYAIGDVTGPPLLAHRASKQGLVAADVIAGKPERFDVRAVPAAIFTTPEIASVGYTEEEAVKAGRKVKVGKFPFAASGRALALAETDGFVKLVSEEGTDLLLGAQAVGPQASDLIAEAALAIEMGATAEDVALTVHAHPTLSETWMEAAEAVHGTAVHILTPKRTAK